VVKDLSQSGLVAIRIREYPVEENSIQSTEIEELVKSCPRCGSAGVNKSNPSGQCSSCLKKPASNKKKPGHWQRAQTKADDALRRQNGKNATLGLLSLKQLHAMDDLITKSLQNPKFTVKCVGVNPKQYS